jgi:hypothetical protein
LIFAAVNGGEHGEQYQVGEMDPAELDRWTVFDVEPSVEDWLAWAKNEVDSAVWDFINTNHAHLEHSSDFEPNKVYPSRRSWQRLNDCLVQASLLKDASPVLFNLAASFVGFEAAVAFNDFIANRDKQVSFEDVIYEGKLDLVKDFDINDHNALIEKMEAQEIFKDALPKEHLQNLAEYFVVLPSEVAMKLWTSLGANITFNFKSLPQSVPKCGLSVSQHLVQILTGE